ncbi:unnamed protein product [Closterium sp. Yama58-4]|nr:unnamed protein product [Closterium sp. Yama58-4]
MRLRNNKPMRFADPIPWNFGVFPQTWADSSTRCPEFGNLPLDDSPVELIDIGSQVRQLGEAYAVEPLAAFVLVDPRGFQLSWKVVGIATDDPSGFQDLSDENVAGIVQTLLDCIRDWLRAGRHCGGEKTKVLTLSQGKAGQDKVMEIVAQAHAAWQLLRSGEADNEDMGDLLLSPNLLHRKPQSGPAVRIFAESYATDSANKDKAVIDEQDIKTLVAPVFGSSFMKPGGSGQAGLKKLGGSQTVSRFLGRLRRPSQAFGSDALRGLDLSAIQQTFFDNPQISQVSKTSPNSQDSRESEGVAGPAKLAPGRAGGRGDGAKRGARGGAAGRGDGAGGGAGEGAGEREHVVWPDP